MKVIGWYLEARVYRKWQEAPEGAMRLDLTDGSNCGFLMETSERHAVCLEPSERTLTVPTGLYGLGCSNLWFCDATEPGRKFLEKFRTLYNPSKAVL
jgi:hypothetical protein